MDLLVINDDVFYQIVSYLATKSFRRLAYTCKSMKYRLSSENGRRAIHDRIIREIFEFIPKGVRRNYDKNQKYLVFPIPDFWHGMLISWIETESFDTGIPVLERIEGILQPLCSNTGIPQPHNGWTSVVGCDVFSNNLAGQGMIFYEMSLPFTDSEMFLTNSVSNARQDEEIYLWISIKCIMENIDKPLYPPYTFEGIKCPVRLLSRLPLTGACYNSTESIAEIVDSDTAIEGIIPDCIVSNTCIYTNIMDLAMKYYMRLEPYIKDIKVRELKRFIIKKIRRELELNARKEQSSIMENIAAFAHLFPQTSV